MKRLLPCFLMILSVQCFGGQINSAYPGIVTIYHLNEGTGASCIDSSVNVNSGTISGNAWVDGLFRKAINFIPNGYIDCGYSTIFNIEPSFTIISWVKLSSYGVGSQWRPGTLVSKYGSAISFSLRIENVTNGAPANGIVRTYTPTGNWHYSSGVVPLNKWTMVAWTFNGSSSTVYLNGRYDSMYAMTAPTTVVGHVYMGKSGWDSEYLDGLMDEVSLYNRALSANELYRIYNEAYKRHGGE